MGSNNKKGKLEIAAVQSNKFTTVAAQIIITAYTDRQPTVECSGDVLVAIRLIGVGLAMATNQLEQDRLKKAQADIVDKEREFLGPREK